MDALFKPLDKLAEIVGDLRVSRIGGLLSLRQQRRQLLFAQLLEFEFARDDIQRQLMIVLLILGIQLVEHLAVGNELFLMILQRGDDLRNVRFDLVVLRAKLSDVVSGLFEQPKQAALLAFVHIKAFQLGDQLGQHIGNRAGVLGLHVLQNLVGELGNLRLRGVAVLEHRLAVVNVDALHKRQHGGLFFRRKVVKIQGIVLRVHRGQRLILLFLLSRGLLSLFDGRGLHGSRGGLNGLSRLLHGRLGFGRGLLSFLFVAGENQSRNQLIVHNRISF